MSSVPVTLVTRTITAPGAVPAGTDVVTAEGPEAQRIQPSMGQLNSHRLVDGGPLIDTFARTHRDLRVSITDKCSLRCTYCMPEDAGPFLPKDEVLSPAEIERLVRIAVRHGITAVRLTGGEPLLRADVVEIVGRLSSIRFLDGTRLPIAMTTNGVSLANKMEDLVAAGLTRVNISIDTIQRERYHKLTRRDRFDDVLAGIDAARASGLRPLKLNAVAMHGVNDDELADLVAFAVENEAQMRFIEQMPLDSGHTWEREKMVSSDDILTALEERFDLVPLPGRGSAPAQLFAIDGGPHTVGVIASVTVPFCGDCDRLRLTADGQMRNCLFAREETDLRSLMRAGSDDDILAAAMNLSVRDKRAGHGINDPDFIQPGRGMNAIGG